MNTVAVLKHPPHYHRALSNGDWYGAAKLWSQGKDTLAIAKALGVHESVVYNQLPRWRKAFEVSNG